MFLHIGAMKTGTTYLQRLMEVNADSLDRAGYLFPVEGGWSRQVIAVRDVLRQKGDPRIRRRAEGAWQRMADRILSYEGDAAILSMEFLSFAKPGDVQRIADTFEGAEIHVILTVRDAAAVIPTQWQTSVRNGHHASWPEFAEQVTGGRETAGSEGRKVLQRAQNVGKMLRRWLDAVPPERFHVVTVPSSDSPRSVLWERFASVVGVDPAVCSEPAPKSNTSLGHASTALLRMLYLEIGHLTTSERATIKRRLAQQVLSERASIEPRAHTDHALRKFAALKNRRIRSAIRAAGVDVVGDLNDLPTAVPPPSDCTDGVAMAARADILAAAEFALPRMRAVVDERVAALRASGVPTDDALERLPSPGEAQDSDPLGAAVKELADVVRVAIELHTRQVDSRQHRDEDHTEDVTG
ncbi:MAG: hypothetical protein L0K86_03825 [Actinomycetia bacterium]|nr:hypothetical protein [Actinomycetes bacterium]